MENDFVVGCRVRCPSGMEGTVTHVNESTVDISLDSAPQISVRHSKKKVSIIQPVPSEAPVSDPGIVSGKGKKIIATDDNTARNGSVAVTSELSSIEALRFGLVPNSKLFELTLGFEEARNWILSRFPDPNKKGVISQINGPFGAGKSHMMALIRCLALNEGYAVAQVEVDGNNVSLSQPATLIAKLWQSLKATELSAINPMLNLYVKAVKRGLRGWQLSKGRFFRTSGNLDVVRFLLENGDLDLFEEKLDAFLSGSPQYTAIQLKREIRRQSRYQMSGQLFTAIGQRLDDRPTDFIDNLVANTLVVTHAGYKGLIVTFDEFETEYNQPLSYLDRAEMLVQALYQYTKGNRWPKVPLGLFFAAVGQEGHQGDEIIEKLMSPVDDEGYWELKYWPKNSRKKLAENIFLLYAKTYETGAVAWEQWFEETENACIGDDQIRSFIKCFVARLDKEFGPPAW